MSYVFLAINIFGSNAKKSKLHHQLTMDDMSSDQNTLFDNIQEYYQNLLMPTQYGMLIPTQYGMVIDMKLVRKKST